MRTLLILMRKDVTLELRSMESAVLILSLSIILSVVTALGVNSAGLAPADLMKLFPVVQELLLVL